MVAPQPKRKLGKTPSLKKLAKEILSTNIQKDHHNSVSLHDIVIVMILFSLDLFMISYRLKIPVWL